MNYLFDTQDLHVLGFNQCLIDNYPTRFRAATEAEIDSHFDGIGKSRHPVDAVEARKEERRLMAEADAKEKVREEIEYREKLQANAVPTSLDTYMSATTDSTSGDLDAEKKAMRVARAKKAGAASKAKRDAAKAAK
jgi:hypothetical protein